MRKGQSAKLPDLRSLSEADLTTLAKHVEQELASRRDTKRLEFFASIRKQAEALGVAPEEVAAELARKGTRPVADRRSTVAPKYRNPMNPSETWAGRGVKPRWMQALLAQGKSMDDFRISS
ncbi:MAG TPA: H-NS histone family protein [Polyangiaceae bacterium]|nr:H-NS histone family protein [Polyangiaceae bacterium]